MMDFLPVAAFFGIAFEPFPACVPMPRPVCRDEAHGHDRHVHQPARRFLECHPLSGQHGQHRYRLHWLLKPVDEAHHVQPNRFFLRGGFFRRSRSGYGTCLSFRDHFFLSQHETTLLSDFSFSVFQLFCRLFDFRFLLFQHQPRALFLGKLKFGRISVP